MSQSHSWRHLLSTRPITRRADLARSMPNNRRVRADGLDMVSVLDEDGTDAGARRILEQEPDPAYYLACAPVQMRLINHDTVWLPGPDTVRSILQLTSTRAVEATLHYWHAVIATAATARPCSVDTSSTELLTQRQRCILDLLLQDRTDDEVARVVGVSVRTVRAEVAAVMARLGVRSRVALGYIYARVQGDLC